MRSAVTHAPGKQCAAARNVGRGLTDVYYAM